MKWTLTAAGASVVFVATTVTAEIASYRWNRVEKAAYYEGTVKSGATAVRFRTADNWLLLQEGSEVSAQAMSENGTPIEPVTIETLPMTKPETPPKTPVAADDDDDDERIEAEEKAREEARKKEAAAKLAEEEPDEPDPTQGPSVRSKGDMSTYLSLKLGLGKEWLAADGGASDYAGASGIGGTILSALLDGGRDGPWQALAQFAAYNFTTTTRESSVVGGASERESKFLRMTVTGGGFYRFGGAESDGYALSLGLGATHFRLPMLDVPKDSATGAADLDLKTATALSILVHAELNPASNDVFDLTFNHAPKVLSKGVEGAHTSALTTWRHRFAALLYTDIGLNLARQKLTTDVTCPAVTGCDSQSSAKVDTLQVQVGLGVNF